MASTVSPITPRSSTEVDRLVRAQTYETLVRLNCEGRAYPGLAASWVRAADQRWTFTIRKDAHFWNGAQVTARDVVASWRATGDSIGGPAFRVAANASILDDHRVVVMLEDSEPALLADPSLAISRVSAGTGVPEGTGPYRLDGPPSLDSQAGVVLFPTTPGTPRVALRSIGATSGRDAIDAGIDLLITGDMTAVSYAAARNDLSVAPLAWDRTYALFRPHAASVGDSSGVIGAEFGASLARDAVRADARAAQPPHWWSNSQRCHTTVAPTIPPAEFSRRVVYRRADQIGRALAERLVALAATDATSGKATSALDAVVPELRAGAAQRVTSAGLSDEEFAAALHAGVDLAYVADLSTYVASPCDAIAALMQAVPWLVRAAADSTPRSPTVDRGIMPLVDTRRRAIFKRDRFSFAIDQDGSVVLFPMLRQERTP
jgi:extracellular solute-binding protein (family 5)